MARYRKILVLNDEEYEYLLNLLLNAKDDMGRRLLGRLLFRRSRGSRKNAGKD